MGKAVLIFTFSNGFAAVSACAGPPAPQFAAAAGISTFSPRGTGGIAAQQKYTV